MISLLRMRNIVDQSYRENQNTNLTLIFFPPKSSRLRDKRKYVKLESPQISRAEKM